MRTFEIVSLISALMLSSTLACRPILRIFESEGYGDDYVEVAREFITLTEVTNVTAHGMTNVRMQACAEGVWMGHDYENFEGMSHIISNSKNVKDNLNECKSNSGGHDYKSLRIIGSPTDHTASALTTYPFIYNDGTPTTYLNDTAILPDNAPFDSFIITGDTEVELFTSTNFRGLSACVGPNNGYINDSYGYEHTNPLRNGTERYTTFNSINEILGQGLVFKSFRFGCKSGSKRL